MLSLERLHEIGCISTAYSNVDYHSKGTVCLAELLSWSESKQARFQGVVICDDCLWAATLEKIPITKASKVYTSDGKMLCCWDSSKRLLFIRELVENKLVTTKQIKLPDKEENNMAENSMANLGNVDLTGIEGLEEMNSFSDNAAPQTESVKTENKGVKSEQSRRNAEFIERMNSQEIAIADNAALVIDNQKYGRSLGFITRTDKSVRLSVAQVRKTDAQGHYILVDNADADVKKKYADYLKTGKNCPAAANFKKEGRFRFKQARPGKIVGMIISIPVATDVNFISAMKNGVSTDGGNMTDRTVKILPMEYAYLYLINMFDGRIKEDEELMGARAAWLEVKAVVANPASGKKTNDSVVNTDYKIRYSMKLTAKTDTRKTLITDGNFVPMKSYKAYSQAEITTPEVQAALNNNVAMLLSNPTRLESLADDDKALVTNNNTAAKYFELSAGDRKDIGAVDTYDGQGILDVVKIAVRDKREKKDGTGYTYPFVFEDDFSVIAKRPEVAGIINKTGLTVDEFADKTKQLVKSNSGSKSGSTAVHSIDIESLKKYSQGKKDDIKNLSQILAGLEIA